MWKWQIGFEYPWMLMLLLSLPIVWYLGYRSLAGLGPVRRFFAIAFRSLVLLLIVAALAGVRWVRINDNVTAIYLVDQSDSIPPAKRQLMIQYAIENAREHRQKEDRVGLIYFGREASIEFPPVDQNLPPSIRSAESFLGRTDATNLESALKLAQASFPEDTSRRVVILTDGNETLGTASSVAKSMVESGIGIDVVPVRLDTTSEVLIEKIDVPNQVRQGQAVDVKVVLHKYSEGPNVPVEGTLKLTSRIDNRSESQSVPVTLDRDINVVSFKSMIQESAPYSFDAEFIPGNKEDDTIRQNNRATGFTYARGKGRVLLVEDPNNIGNYELLIQALRRADIEVDVRTSANFISDIIQLQAFDCVILAGVPRSSGDVAEVQSISDEQIEALVRSTQQFGTGILMLGGPEAFGAGGWSNTKLEEAMPVDFQIKNPKIEAVGALAMVMHASELANGNHWQKVIAKSALDVLGPMDYCGVVEYGSTGQDQWMWGGRLGMLRVGEGNNKNIMRSRISSMTPGDMPDFDPALKLAISSLTQTPASTKHMIVISDGDPQPASAGALQAFVDAGIKISTVAVGTHGVAGSSELQRVAQTTQGTYYVVTDESFLPKIFVREARRVARPLIHEPEGGLIPQKNGAYSGHETLMGIGSTLPRLRGFVLTQVKNSPLVEVPILSPTPKDAENATILATWTYGLGRTAVFTSDGGKRWAEEWTSWGQYDQFFSQLVRWTMRPTNDDGRYQIATQYKDGKVKVVVNALDKQDQFLNFLEMSANGVGPDLSPFDIKMRQTAPGHYVGEFDATSSGNYLFSVIPGAGKGILTSGLTVPFSDEYRVRQANMNLLTELAGLRPVGGSVGNLSSALDNGTLKDLLKVDTYRKGLPPSKSLKDIWPFAVLLGSVLFFADVFVRRVAIDLGVPIRWVAEKLTRKTSAADAQRVARLDQLRGQKSAVSDELDRQRASVQFEPEEGFQSSDAGSGTGAFSGIDSPTKREDLTSNRPSMQADKEEEGYTSRLLKAKRDAKKKNDS